MYRKDYYTTGQFMSLAHVSKKTLRYYDEHNILKPSLVSDNGNRYYTDHDLAKMQQILLLKYLGFSLADIREMTIRNSDPDFMESSLQIQRKLVEDKIEQLQIVRKTIYDTTAAIQEKKEVPWSSMLELIHSMAMEQSLKTQYQNASNISARIHLHALYSNNKEGWFPWLYRKCGISEGMHILENGCGNGSFWTENRTLLPDTLKVTLSDISVGMLRDAERNIGSGDSRFTFASFDCEDIPYKNHSFDLVIANHVLFYCHDISAACREAGRVLVPDGTFVCSTYGREHMKEVSGIVSNFDNRIVLSADRLYEQFGRENGEKLLSPYFSDVNWVSYEDFLTVTDAEPLISYILSCHGNQTQYILDRYKEFQTHIKKQVSSGLHITKDAGIFLCRK